MTNPAAGRAYSPQNFPSGAYALFLQVTGMTGATAASRYAGATTSGAPSSGTFATGSWTVDQTGSFWVCTAGGSPGTWAQVGGAADNPMTGLGDMIYGGAAGSATRLAGNTSVQTEFLSSTGNGGTAAAPAWSVVSGQFLCAPAVYAPPGTVVSLSAHTTTLAAFGSGTITTNSFTFPASGTVIIRASFTVYPPAAAVYAYAVAPMGSVTPSGNVITAEATLATENAPTDLTFVVAGTPGASGQYDLLGAAASGSVAILAFGQTATTPTAHLGAPVVLTVQAV